MLKCGFYDVIQRAINTILFIFCGLNFLDL